MHDRAGVLEVVWVHLSKPLLHSVSHVTEPFFQASLARSWHTHEHPYPVVGTTDCSTSSIYSTFILLVMQTVQARDSKHMYPRHRDGTISDRVNARRLAPTLFGYGFKLCSGDFVNRAAFTDV